MSKISVATQKIYLINRPSIDMENIQEYFSDVFPDADDGIWITDTGNDAQLISEFSGRLCYNSFSKNQGRRTNSSYLENIIESKHGCYDIETEVLTSEGWKLWPDITLEHKLATRTNDGFIEYHHPTRLIAYKHTGKMYRVSGRGIDLLVTPDHKMLACKTTTIKGRKSKDFSLITASELDNSSHKYIKTGMYNGVGFDNTMGPDIGKLLGFSIGDGTVASSGRRVAFHLHKDRKILWLQELTKKLGWNLSQDNHDRYSVIIPPTYAPIFNRIYTARGEKCIPQELLIESSMPFQEGLLSGLIESDGCRGKTGTSFDSTSQLLIGQIQQLCLHVGLAANICYTYDKEKRSTSYGNKPLTRLSIITKELTPQVNKYYGSKGKTCWIEDWEGDVFCARVPNNTLYVRRNGIPVWSGNSVTEHVSWSFLITGISRTLSHELVRHRVGIAISQSSQRYVDESNCRFIKPPLLLEDSEAYSQWVVACSYAQTAYQEMYESLARQIDENSPESKKRDKRIMARQAARSVLPGCVETRMVFTANARALRHIIEYRGARGAEAEIRQLAVNLAVLMKQEAPNLFGDYVIDTENLTVTTEFEKI